MISDSSKAYLESGEAEDIEEAKDFTARDYLKSMRNLGINSLGLDEEQLVKYKQDINDFYKLRQIPSSKRTLEQRAEIHRLKDVIKNLREDSERFFINPETGEIDGEKRKVVKDLTAKYSQEAKTDFQKFSERYKREFDNLNAIDKTLVEAYFGDKLEEAKGEFGLFGKISLEDISRMAKADKLPDISQKGKVNSLLQEKEKSQLNFDALSRALLLNEDPAAVAKGFGSLEGTAIGDLPIIPFTDYTVSDIVKGTGADIFATAFGESFAEAIPGVGNVKSDRDFRKDIVRIANEEGVTLREDQYDSAVATMAEKLGDTFGTSAEIMAEIIVTTLITKNASSAINLAGKAGKVVDFFGGGKKAARIAGEGLKALEQAVAFDLTSQGSAAMGMGEFLGAKGADKLLNLLSKGKTAKFMKFFKPLTRVMGATTAGTVEEYGGEYLEQGFKNGFISKETFRNTFGRDYDEAKDKLLMTLILTGTFGTGAEVANMYKLGKDYYKDSGDQTQLNDVEKAYLDIQKAKQEKILTKFDDMSEEELEKYAEENNVDISNLKKDISAARKAKKLDDMSQEELEKYAEENDISIEDLEVLTAEKEKIKSDDKKEGETVPSAVEEGQEPGDIQVDETSEEEATTGGVLQEEEVVTEGQQVSSDMVVDDELSNPDEDGSIFDLIDNSSSVKVSKVNGVSERGTSVDLKIVTEDGVVEKTVFLKPKKEVAEVEPGDITAKPEEVVEADTFTQEELDQEITEDKLQSYVDKIQSIRKSRADKALSDPLGINAIIDGMLVAVEKSLKAGITLRDAFKKAKKEALETEGLSPEQKKEVESLDETNLFKDVADVVSKVQAKTKSNQGKGVKSTNQAKGASAAVKGIRENQKSFIKSINESSSYLTESQKKSVRNLIPSVKDSKTLQKATEKLGNLVEYGNMNPKTSDIVDSKGKDPKVTLSEKQILIDKLRNQAKGAKLAVKSVKQNQNKFNEAVKEADSYLTEAQRNTVRNLGLKITDSKSLNSALNKLSNIVEYGVLNPKTSNIVSSKGKQKQVTLPETDLNKKLLKAEEQAVKNLSKGRKNLVKEVFSKIKTNTKNISKSDLKKLISLSQDVDTSNPISVLNFEEQVDEVIEKSETKKKKQELNKLKTKLKNTLRKARKKEGNKLGQRGVLAQSFADVNVNDITDLDAFSEATQKMIDSLSKVGTSFAEVNKISSELIDAAEKNKQDKKEIRTERLNKALEEDLEPSEFKVLKDNYENSGLSEDVPLYKFAALKEQYDKSPFSKNKKFNIKDYYELSNDIRQKTLDDSKRQKLEETDEENREWLNNRLIELKDNFDSVTATMTPYQKAIVKDLINSRFILARKNIVGAETLMSLHQSLDEIMSFNSVAGINQAATLLESIKKIKLAELKLKDAVFRNVYKGARLAPNLSAWVKGITKGSPNARKLFNALFGDYETSWSDATTKNEEFKQRLNSLARELDLDRNPNNRIKMGIVSFLKQNDFNLTEEQKQADLVSRLKSIKAQVSNLRNMKSGVVVGSSFKRQADAIEKALKDLGIDLKSDLEKTNLTKSDLDSLLSTNEKKMLDFLENEFLAIRNEMNQSYLMAKGEELELLENYLPTFAAKIDKGKKSEFENNSIKATLSGRTKKRTRVDQTGNTIYNFDIFGTSMAGYMDSMNDIHTLYDRTVLENIMSSKPLKDLFAGKKDQNIRLYNEAKERVANLLDKRGSNYASNIAKTTKFRRAMKGALRSYISLPLRSTLQWGKQTSSIIANSFIRTPKETGESFMTISRALESKYSQDKTYYEAYKKLMNSFNSKLRVVEGDPNLEAASGFSEKMMKELFRLADKKLDFENTEKLEKFFSKLGSGALKEADKIASQGSQLAEFIAERRKQEGKGYKFDLIKEVENLGSKKTKKAIVSSNISSDWINNASDITTESPMWDSNALKLIKNTLFLFKGFSINQSYNNWIDTRNLIGAIKEYGKNRNPESKQRIKEDSRMLAGSLTSNLAFIAFSSAIIKPLLDELIEVLLGVPDPDEEKEILSIEKPDMLLAQSIFDSYFGFIPDDLSYFAKKYINSIFEESAKEEYDNLKSAFEVNKQIDKFKQIEGEFNPYEHRPFYEGTGVAPPGMFGVLYEYSKDLIEDVDIMSGEKTYKIFDPRTEKELEQEYDDRMKVISFINILSTISAWGDPALISKKAIRNEMKNKKSEYKKMKNKK
jgi:hypothetical protein